MRKSVLISILCVSLVLLGASSALAFHDEGVARCSGCHTIHNSQNDSTMSFAPGPGPHTDLLRASTPTDVCLSCHGTSTSRGVWGTLVQGTPFTYNEHGAGNFAYNNATNINDAISGGSGLPGPPIMGYKAGHTPKTNTKGFPNGDPTPTMTQGPGGDFPSSQLGCTSCHDAHGNENFRLLNGVGEVQGDLEYLFVNPAPVALGMPLSSSTFETNSRHTAYKSGMSAWCANCHGDFHQASGSPGLRHPSGEVMNSAAVTYDLYNGTGSINGGNHSTAYLKEVPFEDLAADTNSTLGPTGISQVSCVSCHRAHASANQDAGRWDFGLTFLNEDGQVSGWGNINPWAGQAWEQRSLCNKCHKKDQYDALNP